MRANLENYGGGDQICKLFSVITMNKWKVSSYSFEFIYHNISTRTSHT